MKRIVFYILFSSVLLFANKHEKELKVFNPSLVRADLPFEISVVTEFPDNSDTLFFTVQPNENITLRKVVLRTFTDEKRINFHKKLNPETGLPEYRFAILYDEVNTSEVEKFQLVMNVGGIRKTTKFTFSAYPNRKSEIDENETVKYVKDIVINPYKVQRPAGKSAQLTGNSNFEIRLKKAEEIKKLLVEFWAKFDSPEAEFLTINSPETDESLFGISVNKFQSLEVENGKELVFFNNCFISRKTWYHFSVLSDMELRKGEIYVNDTKFCEFDFPDGIELKTLSVKFSNKETNGKYFIDLLKIWNFGNRIENSFKGKHFLHYSADSSEVLLDLNFDRNFSEMDLENELTKISFGGIQIKRSDAPIFSTVPDLNVSISEAYNSIEWEETDYSFAKTFILEKSTDGILFDEVYEVEAENEPGKAYFYSDYKEEDTKIVFYRIKQINTDGTVSYSPTVKVGQAEHKDFTVEQNYPNPFNPLTTIKVDVIIPGEYKIMVYDLVGNTVAVVHDGFLNEGLHSFEFDGSNLPSGIYFYEVASPKTNLVYKMILAK